MTTAAESMELTRVGPGTAMGDLMRCYWIPAAQSSELVRDGEWLIPVTDDPARRARIIEGMTSAPQHVFSSVVEQVWGFDFAAAASACRVPALYLEAATTWPAMEFFAELWPQLVRGRTVGAGHFNMLEVPEQVNAMIERFLTIQGDTHG